MMRGDRRGQALVEFALILPILVLLLVGIFDFGRAIYAYSTVNNAARQGARLAIVDQTVTHIQDRAASEATNLGIDPDDVTVEFRDLSEQDTPDSCDGAVPGNDNNEGSIVFCVAIVTVPYEYQAATPIIGNLVGTLTLEGESRFKVDFNCEGPECPRGE
jgi:hypothetical protein